MWEFTIVINQKYKYFLDYILRETSYAKLKVISVISETEDKSYLTMAIEVSAMQRLANIIVECICNIILLIYKRKFFRERLDLSKCDSINKCAFLKTLVMFDSVADMEEIKQEIILNKSIDIDSFYYFKLPFMREKWGEILSIISASVYLYDNDGLTDLLKFLVNSLDNCMPKIDVYFNNGRFDIYDNKKSIIKPKEILSTAEESMLSQIIELCPKVINLHCVDNISKDTIDILYSLFDKKINLSN